MTFEIFTIICFIATVAIVPIYMWLLYNIKNSWTSNSHDTQGGSMTIVKDASQSHIQRPNNKEEIGIDNH